MNLPSAFSTGDPSYLILDSTSGSASPRVLTISKASATVRFVVFRFIESESPFSAATGGDSFAGGAFQPFTVDNGDVFSADVKDVRVLQFIERIGDRFTIYTEALGQVLMR